MPRVKRSVAARKKRRKVLEQAKGYFGLKKSQKRKRSFRKGVSVHGSDGREVKRLLGRS